MNEERLRVDFVRYNDDHEPVTRVEVYDKTGSCVMSSMPLFMWNDLFSKYGFNLDTDDLFGEFKRCEKAKVEGYYDGLNNGYPEYMKV